MKREMFTKARLKTAAGVAGLTVAGVVIATMPGLAATSASWNDYEWVSGIQGGEPGVGTLDCDVANFETRGASTFLELDAPILNEVLTIGDLEVKNPGDGSPAVPDPAGASPASIPNAYFDYIDIAALNSAIQLGIDTITLPINADEGVLGSYGRAEQNGYSEGATGLITDEGALDLAAGAEPDLELMGSLSLGDVIDSVLPEAGPLVDAIASLDLQLGAVGSRATLDACPILFDDDLDAHLTREYLIAGLGLQLDSPLLDDITDALDVVIDGVVTPLTNANASLDAAITAATTLLDALELVGADVNLTADIGLSTASLTALLNKTYNGTATNGLDLVSINLGTGIVTVDIAALLGGADGLNGLDPNTQLVVNSEALTYLTEALTDALGELVSDVGTAVANLTTSVSLTGALTANVEIGGIDVVGLSLGLQPGATVVVTALSNYCDSPAPLDIPACLVLGTTTGVVSAALTLAVGAVQAVALPVVNGLKATITGLTNTLVATINAIAGVGGFLFDLLELVVNGIFGTLITPGLLSVIVNAQSAPTDNVLTNPIPPNFLDPPVPAGQYDVAALRIGLLDGFGPNANIDLTFARSSVGINTYLP